MNPFPIDLHIHSVLSPCADLNMSPRMIEPFLVKYGIRMIAIADHNSVLNYPAFVQFEQRGITIIPAMELTTREELHLLCYFPDYASALRWQSRVDQLRLPLPNSSGLFGEQLIINENEEIIGEEPILLNQAIAISLEDAVESIHQLGGLAVPAHAEKPRFSVVSQLGFLPSDLAVDGLELFDPQSLDIYQTHYSVIFSSDAHALEMLRPPRTCLWAERPVFDELKLAFARQAGRYFQTL